MDIFSHGLWAAAAYKGVNIKRWRKGKKPFNVWAAAYWGVFPDLFAFVLPIAIIALSITSGTMSMSDLPRPHEAEPAPQDTFFAFRLASALYSVSHSLVIFLIIFLVSWFFMKRPFWELGGWLMHILMDVPTHSYQFYPTPVLWPLSSWKFQFGFAWGTPWFLIVNYALLIGVFLYLRMRQKRVGISS